MPIKEKEDQNRVLLVGRISEKGRFMSGTTKSGDPWASFMVQVEGEGRRGTFMVSGFGDPVKGMKEPAPGTRVKVLGHLRNVNMSGQWRLVVTIDDLDIDESDVSSPDDDLPF